MKSLHDYRGGGTRVEIAEAETFSASDRVKLSYHPDGFVQFSGEQNGRIVSGKDPVTQEPKGLGVRPIP